MIKKLYQKVVKQDGYTLEFSSIDLKNNKEFNQRRLEYRFKKYNKIINNINTETKNRR